MVAAQRNEMVQSGEGSVDRPKDTLFCPVCGHESAAQDGDWAVTEREAAGDRLVAYECPDCWTPVVVQPVLG